MRKGALVLVLAGPVLAGWALALPAAAQTFSDRFYRDARLKSEFHVQHSVDRVTVPSETPGKCVVYGKVEKVFRGPVKVGQALELDVECKKATDKPRPGHTIWMEAEALTAAKHMESFLNRGPYGYAIALWQSKVIDAPTDKPTMKP